MQIVVVAQRNKLRLVGKATLRDALLFLPRLLLHGLIAGQLQRFA